MGDSNKDKDTRMVCKYGSKCYQKNPSHHEKYKHPPKKGTVLPNNTTVARKRKSSEEEDVEDQKAKKIKEIVSNSESGTSKTANTHKESVSDSESDSSETPKILKETVSDSESNSSETAEVKETDKKPSESSTFHKKDESSSDVKQKDYKTLPMYINAKEFFKEKFLCSMPEDFYQLWEFCKIVRKDAPSKAFSPAGLHLVGPFDVLAGKFNGIKDRPDEEYLLHWRYYYDPPEFQTVLRGDKPEGFHIGYFRDDMKKKPVFLASNCAKTDGTFEILGENIFAAILLHLEEAKKRCDIFKRTLVAGLISHLKAEAEKHSLDLNQWTDSIKNRKSVTKTFNRIGLSVPFNYKTQVGYRDLALNDKDLKVLLLKIKSAHPDQLSNYLNDLQPVLTYASIANDECDFGTGVKLGWDVLFFGIETLNKTVAQFLSNSYNLLGRPEFAKIAAAHMKNRRDTTQPSILPK